MPRPAREVASALLAKGFLKKENDHSFFTLWVDGKKTIIHTKISHGEKEIGDSLLGTMARQLGLTRRILPWWSVVRIKSGDKSNRRLRSSISRVSAAVFSRTSASIRANALANVPISPLAAV